MAGDALRSSAKSGRNGRINEKPNTSVTWIRKIIRYSFLNFIPYREKSLFILFIFKILLG